MAAADLDLTIEQGATFSHTMTFTDSVGADLNVSAWTFRGQIRETYDASTVVASFTFSNTLETNEKVMSLSDTVTAGIEVDEADGTTRTIKKYIYDVEAVKGDGTVVRILQGIANVSPEVTRA